MTVVETPCRDVAVAEWVAALTAAREEGFAFFDWLTAVDQTDDAEAPGFDLVCHVMRHRGPGELDRLLLRTRVPLDAPVASATGV